MKLELNDPKIARLVRSLKECRIQPVCRDCRRGLSYPDLEIHEIEGDTCFRCMGACVPEDDAEGVPSHSGQSAFVVRALGAPPSALPAFAS